LLRLYMVQLNKDTKVDTNFRWARMVRQTISTLLLRLIVFLWPCLPPVQMCCLPYQCAPMQHLLHLNTRPDTAVPGSHWTIA
jgi:hypothetical protein